VISAVKKLWAWVIHECRREAAETEST
jgi:hypothetical protein